jgi:UDP-N-acetylglucosamine--N-acetylmuramyl-(pentapeptide) pyrophosphoryl-undecaprenol N-acetylglucosamine transferase
MPHLVVMAAGTGGHIMPGLAVAREMQGRGWTVSWLGTTHGMENKLVPAQGGAALPLDRIEFSGLRGKGLLHTLTGGLRLLKAMWDSLGILRRRSADAVLGMGGYVCFPGGLMASLLNKPLLLVNADAALLLSNKGLMPVADRVAFGFEGPAAAKAKNAVVTGNPVRAEIESIAAPQQRYAGRSGPLQVLVVGGSLGAQVLNSTVPKAFALLHAQQAGSVDTTADSNGGASGALIAASPTGSTLHIVHQTGAAQQAEVQAAYAAAGLHAEVLAFIDDMPQRLAACDVMICRAGAITVSELCAAGVPAVLVPLVVSTTAHQRDNAAWMAGQGAAIHLPQTELTAERLAKELSGLTRDSLLAMATKARALAKPHAAARVADEIEKLVAKP